MFSLITSLSQAQMKGRVPPLCDLVWIATSPAILVLQYLSQLLTGCSNRLVLLYSRTHDNFETWARDRPDDLARFRRTVQCAHAWVTFRHIQGLFSMPWIAAGLVDRRRSQEDRENLGNQIFHLMPELLDSWLSWVH
jgi:hypothetical protein